METVYLEKTDCGATLTTWVYCAIWQCWSAEHMDLMPYIHWPQELNRSLTPYQDAVAFARCPNMYDWYFEQPFMAAGSVGKPPRDRTWIWENCPEQGINPLMGQPLDVIKAYYRKNFRFNADVNSRGHLLTTKYNLDFGNLMGITWRGTDCVTDGRPRMPIETYFPYIDEVLDKEPGLRIFATAEEQTVIDPLLERYPQAFTMDEFYSSPLNSPHNPERFSPFSGYERGMQPALLVWLLSKCKHYIKNRSSMGMVASWLSTGRIVCLAHPENGGYGFDITKTEINGELSPLVRPPFVKA